MQTHIIIGDGVAGMSAAQYIRGKRPKDKIVIVSNDPQPYYYRAALTNYLSKRLKSQELLAMPIDHWAQLRFERVYGSVARLDHASQSIELADGKSLSYDRMLIATGCRARRMQTPQNDPKRGVVGADQPGIHVMRTFNDTQRIISDIAPNKRVVVLGGGILGIEACHGLHHRGMKVTLVHRQPWLLDKVVDKRAGALIAGKMRRDGIDVILGSSIHAVHGSATGGINEISLNDNHGTKIPCEMVVTCIGNEPNTEWLAGSDVELSRGYIPVNRLMQVSGCKQVWAAGDVAQFADPSQPFPNPSGLWQPARKQGQIAGRDMLRTSAIPDRVYAPGAIYNATKAWDLDLSVIGHHADQDKKDGFESVVFDQVTAEGTIYKKIILKQETNGLRLVGVMLLGDRREGHVLKDLMNLHGDNNWDVSAIKDRIFDPTFDLAAWVAFRKRQPDAKSYRQTGVTSLSPIPISLLNSQMESNQKDLAIATPLKTNMAVATIDASIRLQVEGQSEVLQFKQRGVRIGARQDYDVVVPQKSRTPETLMLSREGFKWVASSDARRRSLVSVNGTPLIRPVTMANGDRLEFLDWKATVVLEDIEAKLAAESAGEVEVLAALMVNGKPFPLRHKYTTIGTSGDNHVILQDPKACFQHAQLHRNNSGAEYILMDVSSTGGTFVNNKQIYGPTKLLPGQTVRMGDSTVVLQMFEKPKRVKKTAIPIRTKEQSIAKPAVKPKAAAVSKSQTDPPTVAKPKPASNASQSKPQSRPKPGEAKTDESLKESVGNKSAKTVVDGPAAIPIFLTVEFGMNEGQVYEVTLPVTIGRSSKAGVTIRDTLLSREHCKIERTKDGYQITDTNSSNGLRVDGEKLAPGVPMNVKPGDSIELGRSLVKFQTAKQHAESVVAAGAGEPATEESAANKPAVKETIEAEEEVIVADLDEAPSPQFNSAVSATSGFGAASVSGAPVKQPQLSADSPFQIDLLSSGDSFTMDGEQDFRKKVFDELDACIGCHECMNACPLEETRSIDNPITIAQLNSYAMGSGAAVEVTNDFIDKCTQCHACVPVCPVDIHRSRIVLWNKLKKGPTPDKKIHVQQMRGGQMDSFESTITARKLANEFEDHPILGCLGETEKIRLFSEASFRQLSNHEMLFREGSYLDSVWFVLDGALETGMATANAEFQTMVLLTAGQCVGEDSVMADQPSEVGVRGAAPSTIVMGLSKYSLKSIMKTPGQGPKEFRQRMEHMYASRSIEAFFNKQPSFQGLDQAVVQQIIQEFSAERYLPGNLILSDSEAESRIGIVKRGFVKEVRLRDGREVVANYLQVGDAFGGIQTDKQGASGVFNRRGQLVRYEAGTAAEVLTSDLSQLGRKFPAFASLLDSSWRTDQFGGESADGCPVGHDGIDLGEVTDVLHATKLLVINTATCVDCDNCVSACQRRHGHARIDRRGSGRQIGQFQVPASCFHCEDPVCLLCGVDGIVREPTGEIRITDNCIGCRQCAERCPYDNIQMVPREDNRSFLEKWLPKPLGNLLGFEEPDVGRMADGEIVATKCDLCHGYDGLPACVRSCPTGAAQRVDPLEHFLNK